MQHFKIAHQFLFLFALLMLGALALLVALTATTQRMDREIKQITNQTLLISGELNAIRDTATSIIGAFDDNHSPERAPLSSVTPHNDARFSDPALPPPPRWERLSRDIARLKMLLNDYSRDVDHYFPEEGSLRDHIVAHAASLIDLAERLDAALTAVPISPDAPVLFDELIHGQSNLLQALGDALDKEQSEVIERIEGIKTALNEANWTIWLSFSAICLFIMMAAFYVTRHIVRRIKILQSASHSIGGADLSISLTDTSPDELGDLARSFNTMTNQLAEMIARRDAAEDKLRELNTDLESLVLSRTQEFKQAKDLAEDANRAKTKFLASMGHELRTPLNAIMGFAQMIKICDLTAEKEDEYVTIIIDNCRTLLTEINQLLILSKLSDADQSTERQPVDLSRVIETCITQSKPLAREYGVKIQNKITFGTLPHVWGSDAQLITIFNNLLANAIKYNRPDNPQVIVRDQSLSHGWHRVIVEDTGEGIDESFPGQALEPFERLRHYGGSIDGCGVGLTIVNSFVNTINGKMGYEPRDEGGTRFWVDLEVTKTEETAADN